MNFVRPASYRIITIKKAPGNISGGLLFEIKSRYLYDDVIS